MEKQKLGEKEPKSRSRRRSTFERQKKKKKEEKIYQKTSTDAGHDVVVVVVQACPEIKSSVDCPFPIINFVPKRKTLNANFIHGI